MPPSGRNSVRAVIGPRLLPEEGQRRSCRNDRAGRRLAEADAPGEGAECVSAAAVPRRLLGARLGVALRRRARPVRLSSAMLTTPPTAKSTRPLAAARRWPASHGAERDAIRLVRRAAGDRDPRRVGGSGRRRRDGEQRQRRRRAGLCGPGVSCGARSDRRGRARRVPRGSLRAPMRIFSGIQPTGRKHLGNYIGAITQYVDGQDRGEAIYCIVDLHAIDRRPTTRPSCASASTTRGDPARRRARPRALHPLPPGRRRTSTPSWPGCCRASPRSATSTACTSSRRSRARSASWSPPGCSSIRCCMAADVLAYRADEVPVGDDQRQHIELMRDVAERFNARFGEMLVVPEHRIPEVGARIMDLQDPDAKMSTTGGTEQGTVYVLDEPDGDREEVQARGDRLRARGASARPTSRASRNLIEILAACAASTPEEVEGEFDGLAATATSRRRSPTRSSTTWPRCASATQRAARATRPRSRRSSPRAPSKARAIAVARRSPTCARRWASAPPASTCPALSLVASRRARARPRRLRGSVRPAADARPARGGRPARGRPRRRRARLPRPPRGARRARPRGRDRVPRAHRRRCWS